MFLEWFGLDYARISSDRDGYQLGVRRQLADCEALAKRKRWTVVDRYVDDDVSAYAGAVRPEYRRLLGDAKAGVLDAIVVWHLDRLHRQPRELEEFFDVVDAAGVTKLASVTGDVDLATDDGRFMARILGAVARKESDDKSRRIRRKAEEIAQAGRVGGGGTRPYGFEADRVTVRESEAAVIRECVQRFLAGEAIRSIARDLNNRGVPTVKGGRWKTPALTRLLGSPRISGAREHRGEIVAQAEWPAIVTPEQTARVRAILADPSRRTNRSARRYLLLRLLRCGRCGEALVSRPASGGVAAICVRLARTSAAAAISTSARTRSSCSLSRRSCIGSIRPSSPLLAGSSADPDAERVQAEVDSEQAQLDELAEAYGQCAIGLSEWLAARKPIEERLTIAKRKLARLGRVSVLDGHVGNGSALRERWADLPLSRQRAIIAAVLDHVVVGPGRRGLNRFDPGRLEPVWRV